MQASNGQPLPQRKRAKPKRHNGKLCPLAIRQRIVNALANGDSIRSIARSFHVSNHTVAAVRDQEWQQVAARKERIAAQCEKNAEKAFDQLHDRLCEKKRLPVRELIPIAGVCVDKIALLRGGERVADLHQHLHEHLHISEEALTAAAQQPISSQLPPLTRPSQRT
jgi:transposase